MLQTENCGISYSLQPMQQDPRTVLWRLFVHEVNCLLLKLCSFSTFVSVHTIQLCSNIWLVENHPFMSHCNVVGFEVPGFYICNLKVVQCLYYFILSCWSRYGEHVLEAIENPKWICPVCRGICSCSFCRAAKGWPPTGRLLYRKVAFKTMPLFFVFSLLSSVIWS